MPSFASAFAPRKLGRAAVALTVLASFAAAAACSSVAVKPKRARPDAGDPSDLEQPNPDEGRLPAPVDPDYVNEDAGVFGPGDRKSEPTTTARDAGTRPQSADAGALDAGADAGAPTGSSLCAGPLAPGDLAVVEIMIQSAAGAGDRGEWVEIQSTRDCTLNLRGLRVFSPRGDAGVDSVEVGGDVLLPPNRIVVVANSPDVVKNNNLPGVVLTFAGEPADVFKNDGDTISLTAGGATIDTLTYPRFTNFQVGRSISFPADCAWSDRPSWARWSYSFYGWSGALKGTPNQDNVDVACY